MIYSYSKLNTFEQCSLKYKYKYIDRIIPEIEKTIETHLGKTVHTTLEWLYTQVIKNKIPTIDEVIAYYSTTWEENYKPEILIIRKELTAKEYFNNGIKFLLEYYTKHYPFDDNTLELEKRIMINLDELGEYKLQGFIDRLVHNLEKDEYEIHDYKTANNLPRQEQIDNDKQLALYSIAIKELFGQEKKVILIWHYLAHNTKICSQRSNEQLQQLKEDTISLIKQIESTIEFPANKTILCDWCEYKNICPEFNKEPKEEVLDIWD